MIDTTKEKSRPGMSGMNMTLMGSKIMQIWSICMGIFMRWLVVSMRFDEHHYNHRKIYCNKGTYCRATYPQIDNKKTILEFDQE